MSTIQSCVKRPVKSAISNHCKLVLLVTEKEPPEGLLNWVIICSGKTNGTLLLLSSVDTKSIGNILLIFLLPLPVVVTIPHSH